MKTKEITIISLPKDKAQTIFETKRNKLANLNSLSSIKRLREEIKERKSKENDENNKEIDISKPIITHLEDEKLIKEKEEALNLFFGSTPGFIRANKDEPDGHFNDNMPKEALIPGIMRR